MLRFLVLLSFAGSALFGQFGIFGRVTGHLSAGDLTPEIVYTKILNAGEGASWSRARMAGKITVIVFFPDTSSNPGSILAWNKLSEQFADKPVTFAWITAEDEAKLGPWLGEHPVKGWMFLDAAGITGRSFGIEEPASVIIAKDGRIIGFDQSVMPTADTLNAVLEGRITTVPPAENAASLKAFMESGKVLLEAEPPHEPGPDDHKPNVTPSYQVHISPSDGRESGNFSGDGFRNLLDMDVKSVIAQIYRTNAARVVLPAALNNHKRYNFAILLPKAESSEEIDNRLLHGIEEYFHVIAMRDQQMMDVYVVTALDGKAPNTKIEQSDDLNASLSSASSVEFRVVRRVSDADDLTDMPTSATLGEISGIAVDGTMDDFCRTLEQALDRPLVNETNVRGEFAFRVEAGKESDNHFLEKLRDELNLVIAPGRRGVPIVALKPR